MEGIKELIESIPSLFIYFIPGYITLYMKQIYKHEKDQKESHLFIFSMILSFIIKSVLDMSIYIINICLNYDVVLYQDVKSFLLIIIAIAFGVVSISYKGSKLEKKINKCLGNDTISEAMVWNYAMKASKGAWVRVYLYDENIVYM
ncbi:hypothetical protein [Clostridium vincentii]|uniref:Uncharacterized protein n=1 Tax=Clostridium vincentii TaxID=52704 RepID=A0A2T0BGV4_9CLOT|nr:hypothetical protein [Clostridium vincentii]PRR83104.1 hypothetical protein CLVI_11390 [Clostridium vincentii]